MSGVSEGNSISLKSFSKYFWYFIREKVTFFIFLAIILFTNSKVPLWDFEDARHEFLDFGLKFGINCESILKLSTSEISYLEHEIFLGLYLRFIFLNFRYVRVLIIIQKKESHSILYQYICNYKRIIFAIIRDYLQL